jgi:hypothetical protein
MIEKRMKFYRKIREDIHQYKDFLMEALRIDDFSLLNHCDFEKSPLPLYLADFELPSD